MLHDLLAWRWGPREQFGIGTVVGFVGFVLLPSVLIVLNETTDLFRQPVPPPRMSADFTPARQEVCTNTPGTSARVEESNEDFARLGWPVWPPPATVSCVEPHDPAPAGTVRWHPCDSFRKTADGRVVAPCEQAGGGATFATLASDGTVSAVDIYIRPTGRGCRWAHEEGHARRFLVTPEQDAATPFVRGAHTEKPGHLMAENCGDDWTWLDRRPGGDWPSED